MKTVHSMIAAVGLASILAAPAEAAQTDPEVIIYRFPGVRDDGGGPNVGVATVFHCTNFSGAAETLRFVTRDFDSGIKSNGTFTLLHLRTTSVVTHNVAAYGTDLLLATNVVNGGTTAIAATSTNIVCTAMTIDAANPKPTGVSLRGIRFSPVPGSQE